MLLPFHRTYSQTNSNTDSYTKLMLTFMRVPVPPSLVISRKAEHRNSEENGQDDIRGNDAYYRPNIYYIAGTTFCEREKRLWHKTKSKQHHIPESHRSKWFGKATYLAVRL